MVNQEGQHLHQMIIRDGARAGGGDNISSSGEGGGSTTGGCAQLVSAQSLLVQAQEEQPHGISPMEAEL